MLSDRICRAARTAAIACSFVFIFAIVALADDRRQNAPGEFDFYVLALSWSPTFCESSKERASPTRNSDPVKNTVAFLGAWRAISIAP